jgi:hypothetical protein
MMITSRGSTPTADSLGKEFEDNDERALFFAAE